MCVTPIHEITSLFRKGHGNNVNENDEMELSLHTLSGISPTFISNITVNDWQMNIDDESRQKLIAFSSEGVEIIGKYQQEKLPNSEGCFALHEVIFCNGHIWGSFEFWHGRIRKWWTECIVRTFKLAGTWNGRWNDVWSVSSHKTEGL